MKIATLKVTVAAGIMALLSACSSQTSIDSDLGVSGAPDWVNIGTQAVENDSLPGNPERSGNCLIHWFSFLNMIP